MDHVVEARTAISSDVFDLESRTAISSDVFTSRLTLILRPIRPQCYVQFYLKFTSNSTSILRPIRPQFYVQFETIRHYLGHPNDQNNFPVENTSRRRTSLRVDVRRRTLTLVTKFCQARSWTRCLRESWATS